MPVPPDQILHGLHLISILVSLCSQLPTQSFVQALLDQKITEPTSRLMLSFLSNSSILNLQMKLFQSLLLLYVKIGVEVLILVD